MSTPQTENERLRRLLQQMVDVAENADETGYVTDVGFVDIDKLHIEVRAALAVPAATAPEATPDKGLLLECAEGLATLHNFFHDYMHRAWEKRVTDLEDRVRAAAAATVDREQPESTSRWKIDEREPGDEFYGLYDVVTNGEREFRCPEEHDAKWLVHRLNTAASTHNRNLERDVAAARARLQSLEQVADHLEWVLPMAKGFAAAHRVGNNVKIAFGAEDALLAYRAAQPVTAQREERKS